MTHLEKFVQVWLPLVREQKAKLYECASAQQKSCLDVLSAEPQINRIDLAAQIDIDPSCLNQLLRALSKKLEGIVSGQKVRVRRSHSVKKSETIPPEVWQRMREAGLNV